METNNTQQNFFHQLKAYLETRYKLLKLEAIEGGSSIFSIIVVDVAIVVTAAIALTISSVALGYLLGELIGSRWAGFGCTALLYLAIILFVKFFKTSVETVIFRAFVRKLLKRTDKEQ